MNALESGFKVIRSNMNGKEIHTWLCEHKRDIDLMNTVDALSGKRILLIGGWDDNLAPVEEHAISLYRAFQKKKNSNCKLKLFESNHSFTNVITELQQSILDWIKNSK